jgi:hypothetical protein
MLAAEASVYKALTDDEKQQLNEDGEVTRFVKACNGNQTEALKRLRATFKWRAQELPRTLRCTICDGNPKAHFMHVVGHDDLGRPVIYSCLRNASNRSTEDNRLHMLATFEQAIRMMPEGVSQWVWASDFHGFGYKDLDPRMARIFLHVSAEHYPERLGHFLVIDPPSAFSALWRMVQPWVDPVTKAKVTFCSNKPADIQAATSRQNFSEELTSWLLAEMKENRNSKTVKAKVYSYRHLEEISRQPQPSSEQNGGHNLYGTDSLLRYLRERPQCLDPELRKPPVAAEPPEAAHNL